MIEKIIDISVPVSQAMVCWPGSPEVQFSQWLSMKNGDCANDTLMKASVHSGTHVDAPSHYLPEGKTVDQIPLSVFVGDVFVVECLGVSTVQSEDLERADIPIEAKRLLVKTNNSEVWKNEPQIFKKDFVALSVSAAQWVTKRGIRLVGIDYFSIESHEGEGNVHRALLEENVAILESLNLEAAYTGWYELCAVPQKLIGPESAPVRAILFKRKEDANEKT